MLVNVGGNDIILDKKCNDTITVFQATMLVIISLALVIHVEAVPFLLKTAGRDAWLAELACIPIALGAWAAVVFVVRLCPTLSVLERIPRWTHAPFIIIGDIYVVITLAQSLDSWSSFVSIVFLPGVPMPLVVGFMVGACLWISRHGLQTIAVTVGVLLPFIMLFGMLNTIGTLPVKQYDIVFPLLENGVSPVIKAMLFPTSIAGEFVGILYFSNHIHGDNIWRLGTWMWTFVILAAISIGLVMGILAEYGPYEAAHLRFPAFGGWRMLTFGTYIDRLDYLAIYQWTAGLAGRTMLLLFMSGQVVRDPQIRFPHMIGVAGMASVMALLPLDFQTKEWLRTLYYPFELGIELFLLIFIGIGSWIHRSRLQRGVVIG